MRTGHKIEIQFIDPRDLAKYPAAEVVFKMSFKITFIGAEVIVGQQIECVSVIERSANPCSWRCTIGYGSATKKSYKFRITVL